MIRARVRRGRFASSKVDKGASIQEQASRDSSWTRISDETTYFVLQSQDISNDVSGVVDRIAFVIQRMEEEIDVIETQLGEDDDSAILAISSRF